MDGFNSHAAGGSLQISYEVIEKIAKHACLEVEGVASLEAVSTGAKVLLDKIAPQKPIRVELNNDVADVEVSLVVKYGTKIPELSEKVQQNVKDQVQNMTNITVGRVDIIITGVAIEENAI